MFKVQCCLSLQQKVVVSAFTVYNKGHYRHVYESNKHHLSFYINKVLCANYNNTRMSAIHTIFSI